MFTQLRIAAGRRPMTDSEARISAVVGLVLTLLFLAAILEEFTPQKLSVVFYILFWVPMLILHELGHAVAARMLGWRVREIVIGFGRTLWQFRYGETLVKIKMAPIEGYVLPAPVEAGDARLKSMLIYAAGPGAELLLLAFLIAVLGWDTVFNDSDQVPLIALKTLAIVIIVGAGFNLLPFRTEGAVSDGLGILSSPFLPDEAIEMRLLTFEMREIQSMLDRGRAGEAVELIRSLRRQFPANSWLELMLATALAGDGKTDEARAYAREKLAAGDLPREVRRAWLAVQAEIELECDEPDFLVLDLALQKALGLTPEAPDLLAIRGASWVMRGRYEDGGNQLEIAWRKNDGSADDPMMLAWLTIAAHRLGDTDAAAHFRDAFEQTNRSVALKRRVESMTRRSR
jgi:hypothetical protein